MSRAAFTASSIDSRVMTSPEDAQPPADRDQHEADPIRKHWLEYLIFLAAFAAAFGTLRQAYLANKQLTVARDTFQITRDQEIRQLRAYIIAANARFSKDENGNLQYGLATGNGFHELLVSYDVINEGVTPAYDVERRVGITEPFYHKAIEITHTEGTAAYISKKQTFKIRTTGFTDDQIKSFMSGRAQFILIGNILYNDIFGNRWPTNFCFLYAARPVEPTFDYCPRWAETDRWNYAR